MTTHADHEGHMCLTDEGEWRPCPPGLCEAVELLGKVRELENDLREFTNDEIQTDRALAKALVSLEATEWALRELRAIFDSDYNSSWKHRRARAIFARLTLPPEKGES